MGKRIFRTFIFGLIAFVVMAIIQFIVKPFNSIIIPVIFLTLGYFFGYKGGFKDK